MVQTALAPARSRREYQALQGNECIPGARRNSCWGWNNGVVEAPAFRFFLLRHDRKQRLTQYLPWAFFCFGPLENEAKRGSDQDKDSRDRRRSYSWSCYSPAGSSGLPDQETGAGGGNRTLVFSLEGCCSTIELHPHCFVPYHAGRAVSTRPVAADFGANRPAACELAK
jgi:hypothetical protein